MVRADETAVARGASPLQGAVAVAEALLVQRARLARPALVNGEVGMVVVAPRGQLMLVSRLTIEAGRIVEFEVLADPDSIRDLEVAVLDTSRRGWVSAAARSQ